MPGIRKSLAKSHNSQNKATNEESKQNLQQNSASSAKTTGNSTCSNIANENGCAAAAPSNSSSSTAAFKCHSGGIGSLKSAHSLHTALPPKHAHIPNIPNNNMLTFQLLALVFSLTATAMQYLHLYRTVWWLPHSHARQALNFFLIDTHLLGYLVMIQMIPFIYAFHQQLACVRLRSALLFLIASALFIAVFACWLVSFFYFTACLYAKTARFYMVILVYPPIAYLLVYHHTLPYDVTIALIRLALAKFAFSNIIFRNNNSNNKDDNIASNSSKTQSTSTPSTAAAASIASSSASIASSMSPNLNSVGRDSPTCYPNSMHSIHHHTHHHNTKSAVAFVEQHLFGGGGRAHTNSLCSSSSSRHPSGALRVRHVCSLNPDAIRDEVELLKADFNRKFRDIFFGTLFTMFYASLIPLIFIPNAYLSSSAQCENCQQNAIHYDTVWCSQHMGITATTAFLLHAVHLLTPAYVDVLHRCALHLGCWRLEPHRLVHTPGQPWSQLQVYAPHSLVKHVKGLFRAVGLVNAAEPGNVMHSRFYFFFYSPLRVINSMCVTISLLLAYQFLLLIQNYEWYKLISVALMMFFNLYSLYKILRNRIVLARCYKEEEALFGAGGAHTHGGGGGVAAASSTVSAANQNEREGGGSLIGAGGGGGDCDFRGGPLNLNQLAAMHHHQQQQHHQHHHHHRLHYTPHEMGGDDGWSGGLDFHSPLHLHRHDQFAQSSSSSLAASSCSVHHNTNHPALHCVAASSLSPSSSHSPPPPYCTAPQITSSSSSASSLLHAAVSSSSSSFVPLLSCVHSHPTHSQHIDFISSCLNNQHCVKR